MAGNNHSGPSGSVVTLKTHKVTQFSSLKPNSCFLLTFIYVPLFLFYLLQCILLPSRKKFIFFLKKTIAFIAKKKYFVYCAKFIKPNP